MSGARLVFVLPLAGCLESQGLVTELTEAWGKQTAEIASPSITAALVLAGMAAQLCIRAESKPWLATEPGDPPPVDDLLLLALGNPAVDEVVVISSGGLQVEMSGVRIMDRDSAIVRFSTSPGSSNFGFEAAVLDGKLSDESNSEPFGRLAFDVQADCAVSRNRVEGKTQWTSLEGRTQKVNLPADSELSNGVGFDALVPYLPDSGTVAWSGRIDGMERTVTTYDAADITFIESEMDVEDAPSAAWPAYAGGGDWVSEVDITILP